MSMSFTYPASFSKPIEWAPYQKYDLYSDEVALLQEALF